MIATPTTGATRIRADGTRRLRVAFRTLARELRDVYARLDRARPDDLHRARVLARRLRALVQVYEPFLDATGALRVRTTLRAFAAAVDPGREADVREVLLERLAGYPKPLPPSARTRLRALLRTGARATRHEIAARFAADDPRGPSLAAFRALRVADGVTTNRLLGQLRRAHRTLRRRADRAHGPYGLHRLRLAVKRLRYALAPVEDLAHEEAHRLLDRLRETQEWLGHQHDATLAIDWVRVHRVALGRDAGAELERRLDAQARVAARRARESVEGVRPAFRDWRRAVRAVRPAPSARRGRA
ncbi:MAG: CHAD domain-containing protein [Steroidobacteraceae bacterium]